MHAIASTCQKQTKEVGQRPNKRMKDRVDDNAGSIAVMRGAMFSPVRTRRAFEIVCDQIRLQITEGKLAPGDRLPNEHELLEQFGVNRSVLREALRSLEMAGLVQTLTGSTGGVYIRQGTSDGIKQAVHDMLSLGQVKTTSLAEARILQTGLAIRLACERATEEDLDMLEADIKRLDLLAKQGELTRHSASLGDFYSLLAMATHNEVIVMLVQALSEILGSLLARVDPVVTPGFIAVRRSVLRHIRARDANKAVAVMTRHLEYLHEYIDSQGREHSK